jgi:hypothetical protein
MILMSATISSRRLIVSESGLGIARPDITLPDVNWSKPFTSFRRRCK